MKASYPILLILNLFKGKGVQSANATWINVFIATIILLQGHANSKAKIIGNKKDDQVASNNCHVANGNGSSALASDKDTEIENSTRIEENDGVDDASESNELRPLKKPKCVDAENCPGTVEDGGFFFFTASVTPRPFLIS